MRRTIVAAAVLAAMGGVVQAADLTEDPASIVVDQALFDWSGLYVGVQGGFAWGSVRVDDYYCIEEGQCGGDPDSRYFAEYDLNGFKGGVHAGFQQQFDTLVLGLESDINWSNLSGDGAFMFYDGAEDETFEGRPGETSSFTMLWEGSTRLKAGLALDRWMPYLTGGIAYGQADVDDHRVFGPEEEPDPGDLAHSVNLIGYTVGAGAAFAVTDDVILRGEARYTAYGNVVSADLIPNNTEVVLVEGPSIFSVEAGVSFKF